MLDAGWRIARCLRPLPAGSRGGRAVVRLSALAGWLAGPPGNAVLGGLFTGSTRPSAGHRRLLGGVGVLLRVSAVVLVVYGGLLAADLLGFTHTPKGFIPTQDMGYLLVTCRLPDAASAERTRHVTDRVQEICQSTPGVKHTLAVAGQSFLFRSTPPTSARCS